MSAEDLAETRFAFSPIWELVLSLRSLQDPAKHALHIPWVGRTREATSDLDLSLLLALIPSRGYMPDFITPPPETPFPEFEEELGRLLATPHDRVRADLARYRQDRGSDLPDPFREIEDDPDQGLGRLVSQMRIYWKTALASDWQRIRALLEGDVLHRARQLALGGADALFADLHRSIVWEGGLLQVVKEHSCASHPADVEIDCGGRGLVLIPAVFAWPDCVMMIDQPWQPTLSYSPRGVANLWEPEMQDARGAMDELIGGTRAEILRTLEIPMTTSEVATRLGVTPGAVSQQLSTLRRAGVVEADRVGRGVYSRLTPLGQSLLELLGA
ncbi:MAG TPA: DUF5937 family protein [Actinomycetota bacterium]|jgi:DNA-binding transcriptional ArsR family regulator|nr:DUF5937 family protein [Actinomycetota bacterium]